MRRSVQIVIMMLCVEMSNTGWAQVTDTTQAVKQDTVILPNDKIDSLPVKCYVVNGFGSGDQELLVLNSSTDVQYAFGYNCDFPDVDFSTKTVLYFSMKLCTVLRSKIKTIGNLIIYTVYIDTNCYNLHKQVVSIVIPKIGLDSSVNLDIVDVSKH